MTGENFVCSFHVERTAEALISGKGGEDLSEQGIGFPFQLHCLIIDFSHRKVEVIPLTSKQGNAEYHKMEKK